jgi:O-antigen/teichoic acid export membrane protein
MSQRPDAPLSERTMHAGLWTVGARLASRLLDFLTLLVLARFLGPADFGLVATAMTVIYVVEAILELPLASALVRLQHVTESAYSTAFTLGLLRGLLIAAILSAVSFPLAAFYGDGRLAALICTLSLAPGLRGMISPRLVAFDKVLDFRRRGLLELFGKATAAALAIAIATTTGSYWAIAATTIAAPAVMMSLSYVMAPMWPRLTLADWPLFSQMAGWNFVSQTLSAVNWQIDRILLPRYVDTASFGRFAAANDLASLPSQAIVSPAMGPLMAAFATARDNGHLKEAYLKSSASFILVLLPVLFFMAAFAGPLIRVLLGPQWQAAGPILAGLAFAGLIALPSIPMLPLALVMDRSRDLATRSFVELLVRVPLSLIGIITFGVPGAIVARAGSAIAVCASSLALTRAMANIMIRDQLAVAIRPLLAIVPASLVLFLCKNYLGFDETLYRDFLASGLAYCLTYAASILVLWLLARRPSGIEATIVTIASNYFRRR